MGEKNLIQKLGIKPGQHVTILNAPRGYEGILTGLPADVRLKMDLTGPTDLIQCFVTSREDCLHLIPELKAHLNPKGIMWVCYPKGSSKQVSDINRDTLRELAEGFGLQTVAMFAIDSTWSALRLKPVAG